MKVSKVVRKSLVTVLSILLVAGVGISSATAKKIEKNQVAKKKIKTKRKAKRLKRKEKAAQLKADKEREKALEEERYMDVDEDSSSDSTEDL